MESAFLKALLSIAENVVTGNPERAVRQQVNKASGRRAVSRLYLKEDIWGGDEPFHPTTTSQQALPTYDARLIITLHDAVVFKAPGKPHDDRNL